MSQPSVMQFPTRWPEDMAWRAAALAMPAAVALWWLSRPYGGIQHDAVFYAADALRRLHPASLGRDLFFHHLSQGDFSWYGSVYAVVIHWLGLDTATWVVTLFSRIAWCAALWAWCLVAVPRHLAAALLAPLLCLPGGYGATGALSVAEHFATPRPLAEAAVLAALALAWRGRNWSAWALIAAAVTVHPLMALGGAALLTWMLPARLRAAALVVSIFGACALVAAGIEPFTRLTAFYDAEWWAIVERQNPMTVFGHWTASDTGHAVVALLLLVDAARGARLGSVAARTATGLAVVLVTSLITWVWATEVRHVLLIQLQVWRALWLVQVMAPALWLAALYRGERPCPSVPEWVLLVVAWCSDAAAAPLLALLALWLMHTPSHRLPLAVKRWLPALAVVLALLFIASRIEPLVNDPGLAAVNLSTEQSVARLLREPVLALLLAGAVGLGRARMMTTEPGSASGVARAVTVASLAAALLWWSASMFRAPLELAPPALASAADQALRPGSVVWSEAGLRWTWLRLGRAHWVSQEQRAGALFSRDAALTWQARWSVLQSLGLTGESDRRAVPAAQVVSVLCAQPGLDELLLSGTHPGADMLLAAPGTRARMSLFDCERRRGMR